MASNINISLTEVKLLAGVKGVEVFVNSQSIGVMQFGESESFVINPGESTVQVVLLGVVNRKSNSLKAYVSENQELSITGKYSRLWGKVQIKLS